MKVEIIVILVSGAFMLLDIISGNIEHIAAGDWKSSAMRVGLFHKVAFILCIVLGILCDFGQRYVDLGFNVPLTITICTYIIVCEIGSILENIAGINPDIVPEKILKILHKGE